jgi:hypothetical protein
MAELPIIVDVNPWPMTLFGVFAVAVSLYLLLRLLRSARVGGFTTAKIGTSVMVITLFGLGVALSLANVTWQFRIDEHGMALRAPFDILRPGGEVAWRDVASIDLSTNSYRGGPSYKLHIRGRDGTEITLLNVDRLPAQFARVFTALLSERAPQARRSQYLIDEFDAARNDSHGFLSGGYTVHGGTGTVLR